MRAQKLSATAACFLALFSFAASAPIAHAQQFAYCKSDVRRLAQEFDLVAGGLRSA